MRRIAFVILCMTACFFLVNAHSGGTDSDGGHYNRSTGEYHYHHGYSAHQHRNGFCPYDYDDRTGENSGGSNYAKKEPQKPSAKNSAQVGGALFYPKEDLWWGEKAIVLAFFFCIIVLPASMFTVLLFSIVGTLLSYVSKSAEKFLTSIVIKWSAVPVCVTCILLAHWGVITEDMAWIYAVASVPLMIWINRAGQ